MKEHLGGASVRDSRPTVGLRPMCAVGVGLLTGSFAAWAYYDDVFRPLAHTFGMWIATVALLSARQPRRRAIVVSLLALVAAVVAFYVGKKVMYGIDYPGMPYAINVDVLVEWLVLAVIAGALLGSSFACIGTGGRSGSISAAAAVGLLVADAHRRTRFDVSADQIVIGSAALAVAAVLIVAVRRPRQLLDIAAWTVLTTVIAFGLVSAPDALEQLLITGSL